MYRGIDVSNHQGIVDWYAVRASGVEWAMCKATEGTTYRDPFFLANRANATRVGLAFGAYHFARPSSGAPKAEADHFLAMVGDFTGVQPVLDIEDERARGGQADWILTWMDRVERATGQVPWLYTYAPYWRTHGSTDAAFERYPLWLAAYQNTTPAAPKPWSMWTAWQYTSSGQQPGVNGRCDLNYGTCLPGRRPQTPTPPKDEIIMAAALDAHDLRETLVRLWFREFLGRNPGSVEELNLHIWVAAEAGLARCLTGIIDSPEGQAYHERTRV